MLFSNKGGVSWIVVFLGNPGQRYSGTRHNAGFMAADVLEREKGVKITHLRFRALTAKCRLGGEQVFVMKPQTFMNISGEAVVQAVRFYNTPPERVIVVSDDVSLPTAALRIRTKGSAGGHNGLKSIISHLGTDEFPRIKIGVGSPENPDYDMADWVLSGFHGGDSEAISEAAKRAVQAVETYISQGPDAAMNKFN